MHSGKRFHKFLKFKRFQGLVWKIGCSGDHIKISLILPEFSLASSKLSFSPWFSWLYVIEWKECIRRFDKYRWNKQENKQVYDEIGLFLLVKRWQLMSGDFVVFQGGISGRFRKASGRDFVQSVILNTVVRGK